MERGIGLLLVLSLSIVGQALTPAAYITQSDRDRFKNIFAAPYGDDLEQLHYSIQGFRLLGEAQPEPQKVCDQIKKNADSRDVETLFYIAGALSALKAGSHKCEVTFPNAELTLNAALASDASALKIYHSVSALRNLGLKIDVAKVTAAADTALKADDTPLSHAYVFYATSYLTGDLKKFHDLIEDVTAQADEVDERYLQFEGGLATTARFVDASYQLAAAANLTPNIAEDKVVKFANYFLSRKHTQSVAEAAVLLAVISTLTTNKFNVPVAVTLASQVSVSDKSPSVRVRVSNLLGKSLGKLTVTADTARHLGDDAVVLSKKPFSVSAADPSMYELELMKVKPERGFYRITISVSAQQASDIKLLGTTGAEVEVKVITQVSVENVELSVADKEQSTVPKANKLQHPNKIALEADHHQRITTKFTLKDKVSGKTVAAHQTFIRLTNQKTKQEVIFVAEEDTGGVYHFDLDVGGKAKDFNNLSGKYSMDLIIGDAIIENPISWTLADVQLTFADDAIPPSDSLQRYSKKPEIKHLFREPEKRPPMVVSNLFTGLVLVPLALLILLWLKIGVNISNFPFSISAIGFHVGMSAIFGLYGCYFLNLNMFTTLRYLGLIGIPTFLFGNKLLSKIAAKRK